MRSHRGERLTEQRLIHLTNADISTIRRYFRTHLGTTPLAFHRKIRLQYARELITAGSDYLSAAFECGYESSSGFREAFTRLYGKPPGRFYAQR
jgi:AraC family transcriptional regulator of adaptative response/methylated-DNA-[protein]-cysteine methyltransferase